MELLSLSIRDETFCPGGRLLTHTRSVKRSPSHCTRPCCFENTMFSPIIIIVIVSSNFYVFIVIEFKLHFIIGIYFSSIPRILFCEQIRIIKFIFIQLNPYILIYCFHCPVDIYIFIYLLPRKLPIYCTNFFPLLLLLLLYQAI